MGGLLFYNLLVISFANCKNKSESEIQKENYPIIRNSHYAVLNALYIKSTVYICIIITL